MSKTAAFVVIFLILIIIAFPIYHVIKTLKHNNDELEETNKDLEAISKRIEILENKPFFPIPELPKEILFCGERVPLERDYVREKLLETIIIELENSFNLRTIFLRSGCWLLMIDQELKKAGLPYDLRCLAIIESGLYYKAYSGSARGLWQLTNNIVREYKGRADWWINQGYDPFKSTEIAIEHLKDLYQEFGNWASALAGYNMHKDKYTKQFNKQQATDFYEVRNIPLQTQRFVYRTIAIKLIMENPEKYGYETWEIINQKNLEPWKAKRVKLNVEKASKSIIDIVKDLQETYPQITYQKFIDYNRHILRDALPLGTYYIYIPE